MRSEYVSTLRLSISLPGTEYAASAPRRFSHGRGRSVNEMGRLLESYGNAVCEVTTYTVLCKCDLKTIL